MLQIAALGFLISISADTCLNYTCEAKPIDAGICAWKYDTEDTIHLSICSNNTEPICNSPLILSTNITCSAYHAINRVNRYPGEDCNTDEECESESNCVYHICSGYPIGTRCRNHLQCDIGLYCYDQTRCTAQKLEGEKCRSDQECRNDLGCNIDYTTQKGSCVKYYSIHNGEDVGTCYSSDREAFNSLCSSGVCSLYDKTVSSGLGVCSENISSQGDLPITCTQNEDCIGIDSKNTTYTGTCTCGIEEDGTSYCELWSGDDPQLEIREAYLTHFNTSGVHFCHTNNRWDQTCFSHTLSISNATELARNKVLVQDYPRLQSKSECIENIYAKHYNSISKLLFTTSSYSCSASSSSSSCINYNIFSNSFNLTTCNSTYDIPACDYTLSEKSSWDEITCSSSVSTSKKYPGEECEKASDCLYNLNESSCSDNICQGIKEGEQCDSNDAYSCHVGLYCKVINSSSRCQPLGNKGDECYSDWECDYRYGCNYIDIYSSSGSCTDYFSVGDKESVTCSVTGEQYLCQSGWCNYSGGNSGICVDAPQSAKTTPISCNIDSDCEGKNSQGTTYSKCRAGYNARGVNYCNLFPGDSEGVTHMNYIANYISASLLESCQTARRFSEYCINQAVYASNSNDDAFIVIQEHMIYKSNALYIDNDKCVKALFTRDYWIEQPGPGPNSPDPDYDDDDDDSENDLSLNLFISSAIFLLVG